MKESLFDSLTFTDSVLNSITSSTGNGYFIFFRDRKTTK